jgi:T5SS/PEP-CTERM-associated repeat protein
MQSSRSRIVYTVDFGEDHTNNRLVLRSGEVTYVLGGNTYSLSYFQGFLWDPAIRLGTTAGDDSALRLHSGTLDGRHVSIGFASDSQGRMEVCAGSLLSTTVIDVGTFGNGVVSIKNGGSLTSIAARIGYDRGNGRVIVSGSGSQWTNSGIGLIVGNSGRGELLVDGGGQVVTGGAQIARYGHTSPGTSAIAVRGKGSALINSGELLVGGGFSAAPPSPNAPYGGFGALYVEEGGQVSNTAGIIGTYGGSGTVIVTGAGSRWINSEAVYVAHAGWGTLRVEDGGHVSSTDGYLGFWGQTFVGPDPYFDGSVGTATVTGAGSEWHSSGSLYIGGSATAAGGTGSLTIGPGGVVTVDGDLKVWDSQDNMLRYQLAAADIDGHRRITVGGIASLAGTLVVELIDGFGALPGDEFEVMSYASHSGSFSSIVSESDYAGLWFEAEYGAEALTVRAAAMGGDANLDGVVSIADLGILAANWQKAADWLGGDFNGDGIVNIADVGILAGNWQAGVDGSHGGAVGIAEALGMFDAFRGVVVPEPGVVGVLGVVGLALRRRGRKWVGGH